MNRFSILLIFILSGTTFFSQKKQRNFTRDFYFASAHYELDSIEQKKARKFTRILDRFVLVKIEIIGYTDSDGSEEYNLQLSQKRIEGLRPYFSEMLPDSLIVIIPKGETDPVYENEDSTKHKNRRVRVKGYYSKKKEVVKQKKSNQKKEHFAIKSEDLVAGKTIQLPAVQFHGGTAEFLPGATRTLDKVIPILQDNPELQIEIAGHICCGNQMELSVERAFVVFRYFVQRGVNKERLVYKGYNNTEPKYGDIMDIRNRRVELKVVEK